MPSLIACSKGLARCTKSNPNLSSLSIDILFSYLNILDGLLCIL